MDTDYTVVIASGFGGGRREDEWCWPETCLGLVNAQYSVQMMHCRTVHLTPV